MISLLTNKTAREVEPGAEEVGVPVPVTVGVLPRLAVDVAALVDDAAVPISDLLGALLPATLPAALATL